MIALSEYHVWDIIDLYLFFQTNVFVSVVVLNIRKYE